MESIEDFKEEMERLRKLNEKGHLTSHVEYRLETLKEVENLILGISSLQLPIKDSQGFKDWLKDNHIKRIGDTDFYKYAGFKYTRNYFFEKYTEDKNKR